VNVRRLVLPRRGVHIDLESTRVVHPYHKRIYNLALGYASCAWPDTLGLLRALRCTIICTALRT
jgi:hypothetical protein